MRLPAPYVAEVLVLYTIKTQTRGCPLLDSLVTFSLHCNFVYAGSKSCGHRCGNIVFESRASLVKLKFRSLCAQALRWQAMEANEEMSLQEYAQMCYDVGMRVAWGELTTFTEAASFNIE